MDAVAAELDVKSGQIAVAWLLAQGEDVAPIPGTKRISYLEVNVAAAAVGGQKSDQAVQIDFCPPTVLAA